MAVGQSKERRNLKKMSQSHKNSRKRHKETLENENQGKIIKTKEL